MLTDPSESLDASPKSSTFKTGPFVGDTSSLESGVNPYMGLGKDTRIGAGVYPEQNRALFDDPRRRNEERDPDKAARVSPLKESNGFLSERGGSLAGGFWDRLFPAWEADSILLAMA